MNDPYGAQRVLPELSRLIKPDCLFAGRTRADLVRWQAKFKKHYKNCLGPFPGDAAPRVRRLSRSVENGYVREKILYRSSPGTFVPAWLLVPAGMKRGEKRPGILAAHGHGRGKDDLCGLGSRGKDRRHAAWVKELNYEYGLEAVRRGYVVLAPDWAPFGERRPHAEWARDYRDACDIVDLCLQYFGLNLLACNVWDGMRGVDVLAGHPAVDPGRLGVIGLSYGGTMAAHLLVNDRRLKAGVVSGYLSTVRGDVFNDRGKGNTCGAQAMPGLLRHGDIPEILGLAAPKPVLFEMGKRETCFHPPDMAAAFRRVEKFYRAADAVEKLEKDVFDGDHRWSGVKAWDFLQKWL
jgi:dienelactone hydrolase